MATSASAPLRLTRLAFDSPAESLREVWCAGVERTEKLVGGTLGPLPFLNQPEPPWLSASNIVPSFTDTPRA